MTQLPLAEHNYCSRADDHIVIQNKGCSGGSLQTTVSEKLSLPIISRG